MEDYHTVAQPSHRRHARRHIGGLVVWWPGEIVIDMAPVGYGEVPQCGEHYDVSVRPVTGVTAKSRVQCCSLDNRHAESDRS
jgi:hypothetical protein